MEKGWLLIVSTALLVHFAAAQNVHVVGDGIGWDIPPPTSPYSNWVSGKTFNIGDILVFNFVTNQHDVVRVPKASYDACTQDNAIGSVILTGPANITLDSGGDYYFICTFGRHCQAGQKLSITVGSSTPGAANPPTTAPPATPTTPSPASTQPDPCAPTPNAPNARGPSAGRPVPSPPDSAAASLAGSFFFIITLAGMALVF